MGERECVFVSVCVRERERGTEIEMELEVDKASHDELICVRVL